MAEDLKAELRADDVRTVAMAIRRDRFERTGRGSIFDPEALSETELADGRAALVAARALVSPTPSQALRETVARAIERFRPGPHNTTVGGMVKIAMTLDAANEHARDLESILSAIPQVAEGWRPIETAPRDGTRVLLAGDGEFVGEAWFCEDDDNWYEQNTHPTDATDGAIWGAVAWMPLPAPPGKEGDHE